MFPTVYKAGLSSLALMVAHSSVAFAEETAPSEPPVNSLEAALKDTKPILLTRLRYETVDQDGFADSADALTFRARAGLETGAWNNTTFLIEFDHITSLVDDFNSTINGKTNFPVVPDPDATELNRLQIKNTSIPGTTTTLGRQQIAIDDHRFIGHVGWRQNEQTFDALRFQNTSFGELIVDTGYITQVNRIFGDDSAAGRWDGDSYYINASHPTPLGKLTGFGYFIDVDNLGGIPSSQTLGFRLAGKKKIDNATLGYAASYASQTDYGSSNLDYSADYYFVEGSYATGPWSAGLAYEVLGGDDARGFQTPLATLHKFQGWTDKFLITPSTGVQDFYVKGKYNIGDVGAFNGANFTAIYHDFSADTSGADYGSEIDLQLSAKWKKLGLTLKFADYNADQFSVDTQKVWLEVNFKL